MQSIDSIIAVAALIAAVENFVEIEVTAFVFAWEMAERMTIVAAA